ncbi:MAG: Ldh family oxidoreductase [Clostridia bacterium]|nr:Ldh family oxidoreductase [Clostridia bacterium]
MAYINVPCEGLKAFLEQLFEKCGFSDAESRDIVDVLITADLFGIESHGVSRLIRYYRALKEGIIDPSARAHLISSTAISRVYDAPLTMGQVVAKNAMREAIDMAKQFGVGCVCVRNSNHYGIAGYYTLMAEKEDLLGISMTNTEAIAIPTGGRKAMLGTSPIALCMPAEPTPFWYDAATTVVTRGKLEVYNKRSHPLVDGWAADEAGKPCADAARVIDNIIGKKGGGIFPLGGAVENTGSHKGYGLGVIVELFTAIFASGTTAPHVRNSGAGDTSFSMWAIDYGMFGDKKDIKDRFSNLLRELRESPLAEGSERIYTHGEKEFISREKILSAGVPVNDVTLAEMRDIGLEKGVALDDYIC